MQNLIIHIQNGRVLEAHKVQLKTEWQEVNLEELIALTEADTSDHRKIISILSGIDINMLEDVTADVIEGIMSYCWKVQMLLPKHDVPKYFEFKGKYYFVADLIDDKEWGALEDAKKAISEHAELPLKAAPVLLGIYCRPKNEVYDYFKALQRAELFKGLPAPLAYSLCAFFLSRSLSLWQTLQNSVKQDTSRKRLRRVWKICSNGAAMVRLKIWQVVAR